MLKTFKGKINFKRKRAFIGAASQITLVLYLVSIQFHIGVPEFVQGMLLGFSIVGNIAWLGIHNKKGE